MTYRSYGFVRGPGFSNVRFTELAPAGVAQDWSTPAEDSTFRIKPVRPIEEIRREALNSKPPAENGEFRKPGLVDLESLDNGLRFDIRYATTNNFMRVKLYTSAKAFLQRPAAEALLQARKDLARQGYSER